MAQSDYDYEHTPRRSQRQKASHTGRNVILVLLLILIVMALILWRLLSPSGDSQASRKTSNTSSSQTDGSDRSADEEISDAAADSNSASDSSDIGDTSSDNSSSSATASSGTEDFDLLILVNSTHALPDDYQVELTTLSNEQQVATAIYPELQAMFDAARNSGVYPIVASGYRTAEKQQSLMDEKIQSFFDQGYTDSQAADEALKWVNAVGCSEHQSGLAVDINADGIHSAGYEVYDWLAENAWQYGFILRYPEGKTDITGTDYEPWHYRYVGTQAAEEIYQQGVCLEEYLGETE